MEVTKHKDGDSFSVKADGSPKDQAAMQNVLRALSGKDPLPQCRECGGLLSPPDTDHWQSSHCVCKLLVGSKDEGKAP